MACDWQRVEELFHATVSLQAHARGDYLTLQCADPEVRREVESLLLADGIDSSLPEPFVPCAETFASGHRLNCYQILEVCGHGASATVYRALHVETQRLVAIKVFAPFLSQPQRRRYLMEARAALALNHPNVVKVHEIGRAEDRDYLVMDFVDGRTLGETIPAGGLPLSEAQSMAQMMAEGLAAAHAQGIVHRDLKPANLMLDRAGVLKVLDFGLAKLIDSPESTMDTAAGQIVGTVCYLSPEQAEGKAVDARSDVFSFGVVFSEMLIGERAFDRGSLAGTLSAILRDSPQTLRRLRRVAPREIANLVERCLEKDPARRYDSASEVVRALAAYQSRKSLWYRQPRNAALLAVASVVLCLGATWLGVRQARIHWARNTMAPRIAALVGAHSYNAGDEIVRQIENIIPDDPRVRDFQNDYRLRTSVLTDPPGAEIAIKDYRTPEAPWRVLGNSPLNGFTIPFGYLRWRVTEPGYRTREFAETGILQPVIRFALYRNEESPPGMVLVPAGATASSHPMKVSAFWLDRLEVTNQEFREFVKAGGYRRREFWQEPVVRDGKTLSWQQAMQLFVDQTNRPGPAGWQQSDYPEGAASLPVTGVSWYEAAAYARFAGKELPVFYQWLRAARTEKNYADGATLLGNLAGKGLAPVGSFHALDRYGSYDLLGNCREWIWNERRPGRRLALGGAWNDAHYAATEYDETEPLARQAETGFRCVKNMAPPPESFRGPADIRPDRDYSHEKLVSDEAFSRFRQLYEDPPGPLLPAVEKPLESRANWRKLKVEFAAAYDQERVPAYLFLPINSRPPYQTVVYFPTSIAVTQESSAQLEMWYLDPVIRSGRAVLYPVLWGTYERHQPKRSARTDTIRQVQDIRRAVDYLATRSDIDHNRLAYMGFSYGAYRGPIVLAVEPRFKAAVLISGGLMNGLYPPEIDAVQFAPRAHTPVLLLTGRYDSTTPLDNSQRPLMRLLGANPDHKKHVILEAGHAMLGFPAATREMLDWLDRYLGFVRIE